MTLIDSLTILRTDLAAEGLYDRLFGGLYRAEGAAAWLKIGAFGTACLSVVLVFAQSRFQSSRLGIWSKIFASLSFIFFAVLLNHPVDEVFISLRHSLHLRDVGLFSFNRGEPIEGIVDFLPYALIGLLGKLGLPLVEMTFLQSILGGLLAIGAGYRILRAQGICEWKLSLGVWALALLPTAIFNATIGFTANLFSAAILWAICFLFYEKKTLWGWLVLSLVPLIRLEGALIAGILLALHRPLNWRSLSVFLPLLALEIFRHHTYGRWLPLPIAYKASFGSLFFLKEGARALVHDLLSTFTLPLVLIGLLLGSGASANSRRTSYLVLGALILSTLPYYLSGGDWFPSYWARYLLPLAQFSMVFALGFALQMLQAPNRLRLAAALAVVVGVYAFIPSSLSVLLEQSRSWWAGHGNFRIQQLSRLGNHLKRTTLPQDRIASSEVATVMYFAEREALDLLGVANPRFVGRPLIERTLYRRRYPELVSELQPEILYPGDFVATEIGSNSNRGEISKELQRLEKMHAGWNEFFLGGLDQVRAAGYRPVLVVFGNHFSSLYFVSAAAFDRHIAALKQNGFTPDQPRRIAQN